MSATSIKNWQRDFFGLSFIFKCIHKLNKFNVDNLLWIAHFVFFSQIELKP